MKIFFITIIIIAIVGSALFFVMGGKDRLLRSDLNNLNNSDNEGQSAEEHGEELAPAEPDTIFQEPIVYTSLDRPYSHSSFLIKYPEGFKASSVAVEGGEVVTIENNKGNGFQIFSMAWDESGPITPERIWQDQPDMEINDPKNADLDGSKALVFKGYDPDMGETFEVWIVHNNKLYQITGPKTAEKLITEILETWNWR